MTRRGFTLVETLAAAALLAAMAAACVPLIAQAAAAARDASTDGEEGQPDAVDLARFADQIAARPEAFGIDLASLEPVAVAWPEGGTFAPVEVLRLECRTRPDEGPWLLLRCGDRSALRWIALDTKTTSPAFSGVRR